MTAQSKTVIKSYFETGDKPTQAQFGDLIDSYIDTSTIVTEVTANPITSASTTSDKMVGSSYAVSIATSAAWTGAFASDRIWIEGSASSTGVVGASRVSARSKRGFAGGSTEVDLFGAFNTSVLSSRQVENSAEQGFHYGSRACRNFGTKGILDHQNRLGQVQEIFDPAYPNSSVITATEVFRVGTIACVGVDMADGSNNVAIASIGQTSVSAGNIQVSAAARVLGDRNTMISSTICNYGSNGTATSTILASRDSDIGTTTSAQVTYSGIINTQLSNLADSVSYTTLIASSSASVTSSAQNIAVIASNSVIVSAADNVAVIAETGATCGAGSINVAFIAGGSGGGNTVTGSADECAHIAGSGNQIQSGNRSIVGAGVNSVMNGTRSLILACTSAQVNSGTNNGIVLGSTNCAITNGGDNIFIITSDQSTTTTSSVQSGIMGSTLCTASAARTFILNSQRTESNVTNTVVGGFNSTGNTLTSNRKWQLNSQTGQIDAAGTVNGSVVFTDFAEMFENGKKGEIPAGTIVELDGDKIVPANGDDYIGVISKTAGIILGDSWNHWAGRHLTDEFGGYIMEEVTDDVTGVKYIVPKENPQFDPNKPNIKRSERKEDWSVVGLIGQLFVRIDDSVKTGDYLEAKKGIGFPTTNKTRLRVMKITSPNVAKCICL